MLTLNFKKATTTLIPTLWISSMLIAAYYHNLWSMGLFIVSTCYLLTRD